MTAVRVEVTEGVGERRDEVTVIGKVELTGLPPRPRGTPIEVIYSYGVDQILEVTVIDVDSASVALELSAAGLPIQSGRVHGRALAARDLNTWLTNRLAS